jgi:hypothetical protein
MRAEEAYVVTDGREFDKQAIYQIKVKGNLDQRWSDWFDGFAITVQADGATLLTGSVADQAALHGLLSRIRDLGLPLLSITRLESQERSPARGATSRGRYER